jgi:S1-C subfamily serine protease
MRLTVSLLALATVGVAITPSGAQRAAPQPRVYTANLGTDEHRAALGVATSSSGTLRDTLGVMISAITPGSPAERAGLEEGNRIAAINGVNLRAAAADVDDMEMSGALPRRLARELAKSKPGDEVELRVYRDGRTTSMRLRTTEADSLFRRPGAVRLTRAAMEDRPMLGFALGSSGSRRDTLGVLVMSVMDSTPAARAGLEEGNRIAAIDGTSLRMASEDAGDEMLASAKAQRLQREVSKLTPGSDVTLRVYANGQFRDVRMKVARARDLPRTATRTMIFGGEGSNMVPMTPLPPLPAMPASPRSDERRLELGPEVRARIEQLRSELQLIGPELESIGPALERMRPELERLRTEVPNAIRRARVMAVGGEIV